MTTKSSPIKNLPPSLLVKLGSIVVHAEEFFSDEPGQATMSIRRMNELLAAERGLMASKKLCNWAAPECRRTSRERDFLRWRCYALGNMLDAANAAAREMRELETILSDWADRMYPPSGEAER